MGPGTPRSALAAGAATLALLAAPVRGQAAPPAAPAPLPAGLDQLDPDAPMAPLPDLGVAWPELGSVPAAAAGPAAPAPVADLRRYRVVVTGLEPLGSAARSQFNGLSALVADEGKPANAAQLDRRARDDEGLLRQILRAEGRYDGEVATAIANEGGQAVVRLSVTPGPSYRFEAVTVAGIEGAGPRATPLRAAFAVHPDDPVTAERVNAGVAALRTSLGREGYPFAKVADPQVTVDHATQHATLVLPVTLGDRARFGRIVGAGKNPPFGADHIAVIARWKPGDPYDALLIDDLRRALIQTSLVSLAKVEPVPSATPGVVDVLVETGRAPPRTVAGELGYGTGEGGRASLSWQHRNLFPPEGALSVAAVLGTREQSLATTFRRSNFHDRDRVFTAQVAAAHTNFDAYGARTLDLSATLERQTNIIWQKKWVWSLGTEFVASDERDTIEATGQQRRRTFLVAALPGTLGYDGSDDLLNPTRGFRLSLRASPEASLHDGVTGYAKVQLDGSAYLPVGGKVVIAGRVRLGAIQGAPRDIIAPSRRFYAGGGGSVRGFGYQKIGPTDVDGTPIGGRGLTEGAIEARVRFGNFGVVPFLDTGNLYAAGHPKLTHLRYGTGIGARYYSSFGPIRIDLGTPIARRPGESRVAVYVSLGQAF